MNYLNKYTKYLSYLIRHKWFVFIECYKQGRPITGIMHDWTKFLPSEFFIYADYFYTDTTYKHILGIDDKFDCAWLKHIHRNKHHWQYWILREDDGGVKTIAIPYKYRVEMLCDWAGAGKAQRNPDSVKQWYFKNKSKMSFHPDTERWIEENI